MGFDSSLKNNSYAIFQIIVSIKPLRETENKKK